MLFDSLAYQNQQLLVVERLGQVMKGPLVHSRHGRFHRLVGSQYDNRYMPVVFLNRVKDGQAIGIGKFQV